MKLLVDDVWFWYGTFAALKGVSLSADKGVTFLVGPNGAGKTTLAHVVSGILRPRRGKVYVGGIDVHAKPAGKRLVAIARQTPPSIIPFGLRDPRSFLRFYCEMRGEDPSRVDEVLEELGLSGRAEEEMSVFSPGMRRKVEFAKLMLAESAEVLIADELAGLDVPTRSRVIDFLRREASRRCVIVITHNPLDLLELGGRVAVMHEGGIVSVYSDYHEVLEKISRRTHLLKVSVKADEGIVRSVLERHAERFSVYASHGLCEVEAYVGEEGLRELVHQLAEVGTILNLLDDPITPLLEILIKGATS